MRKTFILHFGGFVMINVFCSFEIDKRGVFLLNGEPAPYDSIYALGASGSLQITIWTDSQRDAIMHYGEKYRYGIIGFELNE